MKLTALLQTLITFNVKSLNIGYKIINFKSKTSFYITIVLNNVPCLFDVIINV